MVDRDYSLVTDVVDLTRKFNTFVMNNKMRSGNIWGNRKIVKFQEIKFVDEYGRRTSVCPLCYEEGHKRKDCPDNMVHHIRRCFKCNGVGHFKDGLSKWEAQRIMLLVSGRYQMGLVCLIGSTKRCFRCQ